MRVNLTKKAFTLIELLVVIAIIALLLSILMPAMQRAKEKMKEIVCSTQIRHQSMALLMYAQVNKEKMPTTWGYGERLWDVSYFTTDVIIASGADRLIFRCPSNRTDTNKIKYWRASEYTASGPVSESTPEPASTQERQMHYRTIGYSYLTETKNGRGIIWAPSNSGAGRVPSARKFISKASQSGQLELIIDSIFWLEGLKSWIIPDKSWRWAMGTSHMGRRGSPIQPSGGNIGYLDGHVNWRRFKDMYERYGRQEGIGEFWW